MSDYPDDVVRMEYDELTAAEFEGAAAADYIDDDPYRELQDLYEMREIDGEFRRARGRPIRIKMRF